VSKKEELEKKKKVEALKQRRQEAMKEAGVAAARNMGKATVDRDTQLENQTAKRYTKDEGLSPIYAKGSFTSATPKDNWGDTGITQDAVDKKKKRK
jgi:hypothetical protein